MIKELQSDMKELRRYARRDKDNETLKQEVNRLKNVLQILKARSAKGKITSRNCGLGDSTTPIYVDEELTKETYALFKKAKQLLREKGYKYVWHREGRILARIADGNNVIWVKNQTVLDC
nr:unnamed protein product [Callosobruchus chinensis]CAH7731123.1 unnamed protein product [Callosobruchus chinensis]